MCLGTDVVCDGFVDGYRFRVQTHVHDDHMSDFDRSKGLQDLFFSPETFALLVAEMNADLEYRTNLHQVARGSPRHLDDGSLLKLLPSEHMLGACQVAVELRDGVRLGYSGDFSWPLNETISVDELVVDSTYGSPNSVRRYTQDEAEQRLIELVCERLRYGSVHVNAYRGTIERVLQSLGGNVGGRSSPLTDSSARRTSIARTALPLRISYLWTQMPAGRLSRNERTSGSTPRGTGSEKS